MHRVYRNYTILHKDLKPSLTLVFEKFWAQSTLDLERTLCIFLFCQKDNSNIAEVVL